MEDQSAIAGTRKAPGLGPEIRRARERRGWTQEELALEMGTDQSIISKWERGMRVPDLATLQRLATVLGYDRVVVAFRTRSQAT